MFGPILSKSDAIQECSEAHMKGSHKGRVIRRLNQWRRFLINAEGLAVSCRGLLNDRAANQSRCPYTVLTIPKLCYYLPEDVSCFIECTFPPVAQRKIGLSF